ncbi:MAG: TonB family protein [Bacteroidota bacterium]
MFNNVSNLYSNEWLAVVFNSRNKKYGAYVLRAQSSSILLKALGIATSLFVLLFLAPAIYRQFYPEQIPDKQLQVEMVINPVHTLKKVEPKKEELKRELPKPIPQKVKTINLSANMVVVDKEVADPPTTTEINQAVIASVTQAGSESSGNAQMPVNNSGGSGDITAGNNSNEIFNAAGVDIYPEFPGGMAAWAKFIQKNLRYPNMAQENEIQGKVFLSFVIEKDGSITDVSIIRGIGSGCDEEAVRVIKKSPKWKSGQQNNQAVRVRYTMPIQYRLTQ